MKPKPQSEEYRAFENVLGEVLTVTKAELSQRLKAEKQEKNTPPPNPQRQARPLLNGPID